MSAPVRQRNAPVWVTVVLTLLCVALAVTAILYFIDTAAHLPSFLPGHQSGSSRHHAKHGLAAALLAVAAFAGAWLSTGTKRGTAG